MPYPGSINFRSELNGSQPHKIGPTVRKELEQQGSNTVEYLSKEHLPDGTHGDMTATSIVVSGDLNVSGTVIAGLGNSEILGNLTVDGIFSVQGATVLIGAVTAFTVNISSILATYAGISQTFFVDASTGDTTVHGDLTVLGLTGFEDMLGNNFECITMRVDGDTECDGSLVVGADGGGGFRFTVEGPTGNTLVGGILNLSSAAAGQIKFPGTQNPSADTNILDDYEEGTWTPADASGAGLSLTITSATYIKVGKQVTAIMNVVYPATASGASAAISGLPFTTDVRVAVMVGFTDAGFAFFSTVQASSTTMTFTTTAGVVVTNVQLTLAKVFLVLVYQATA